MLAFTFKVMFEPFTIMTSSAGPGTIPPTQLVPALQFPVTALLDIVAAKNFGAYNSANNRISLLINSGLKPA
jgi:hypothetical protein